MKIVFATNNQHKLDEIRKILGSQFEIVSLNDIGCHEDIPETGNTLEANALQKAEYIFHKYGMSCFADDTGLEVDALGGAPGVYSARYAAMEEQAIGEKEHVASHDSEANMARLLRELAENNNRKARFRTVIALIIKKEEGGERKEEREERREERLRVGERSSGMRREERVLFFEGIVNGHIAKEKSGSEGFGYDPIFVPEGYKQSFAELGTDIKNQISHRARAVQKLAEYLKST